MELGHWLNYWDVVLTPPLPAIVAIGIAASFLGCGSSLARLAGGAGMALVLAGFAATFGLVGSALHAFAWAGLIRLEVLRVAGWLVASAGWGWIVLRSPRALAGATRAAVEGWRRANWVLRVAGVVSGLVLAGYALAALGPATDADSLDYHLGFGLEVIRAGRIVPRPDWLHFRLSGLGEMIDMLGLAAGTDSLMAVLNWTAVALLAGAIAELGDGAEGRALGILLVVATPVFAFFVPNQKPQLLPSAGVFAAGLVAVRRWSSLRPGEALLAFAALFSGVAAKYSFVLPGAVAGSALLLAALRSRVLRPAMVGAAACFGVIALPLYVRNLLQYGDPLSPFLERFRASPDPTIVSFAAYLREAGARPGLATLLRLPLEFVFAARPSTLPTVLGLGAFAVVVALRSRAPARIPLLAAAGVSAALALVLGQWDARFMLEPYLWASAAAVIAAPWWGKRALVFGLLAQAIVAGGMAWYGAVTLGVGGLTPTLRERVLNRAAYGYAEARWMDRVLPRNCTVLSHIRSVALVPRPFVGAFAFGPERDRPGAARLADLVETGGVTCLTTSAPIMDARLALVASDCGRQLAEPLEARPATRKLFIGAETYQVYAWELDRRAPACRRAIAQLREYASGQNPLPPGSHAPIP